MASTAVTIDPNSPLGLQDGLAFRASMAILDQRKANKDRYSDYATKCNNAALSINAGKALASPQTWPVIPQECGLSPDVFGFVYAEGDGPRTLDQVDPVNFPLIQMPDDHTVSQSTTGPQSGLGNPAGTMALGNLIPGTQLYQALPGDTCAEGTVKTIPGPGGLLIKLRKHTTPWGGYWEQVA